MIVIEHKLFAFDTALTDSYAEPAAHYQTFILMACL